LSPPWCVKELELLLQIVDAVHVCEKDMKKRQQAVGKKQTPSFFHGWQHFWLTWLMDISYL